MKSHITRASRLSMSPLHDSDNRLESSRSIGNETSHVNYITFNQDASCVALGLNNGYRIYTCKPRVVECSHARLEESIGIIEMLYCTSLVAIVGLGAEIGSSPRKLKILNTKRQTTICDLIFPSTVLLVRLTHQRMVVLLDEQIYIYDIKNMNLLHTIETSPNLNLLCALSDDIPPIDISLLAYPSPPKTITHESLLVNGINTNGGSHSVQNNIQSVSNAPNRVGDAIIFDLISLQPLSVIEAHKSALSAMCLSKDGCLLATASDKGTIVRVFNVKTGVKLYQFRRGTYPTKIFSVAFSNDSRYIVATSSSETVHIFRLGEEELLANKQRKSRKSRAKSYDGNFRYQVIEEEAEGTTLSRCKKCAPRRVFSSGNQRERRDLGTEGNSDGQEYLEGGREENGNDEEEVEDEVEDEEEEVRYVEDDGDDSDVEGDDLSDDGMMDLSKKQRKLSQSSSNSYGSLTSSFSNISGGDEQRDKAEPVVDQSRLSVARLIRRSSQHLGRKAAQKMGDYLPSRFSSILEPTRHFASLKLRSMGKDVKSIAIIDDRTECEIETPESASSNVQQEISTIPESSPCFPQLLEDSHLIHINVITSEGYYYTYGLDPVRGGDCMLLHQYFLLED